MKRIKFIVLGSLCLMTLATIFSACEDNEEGLIETRSDGIEQLDGSVQSDGSIFNMESPTDTYRFPIEPGTDEWKTLQKEGGLEAVYKALEIPQSVLKDMSTMGLVQTFIDFPYSCDFIASNSTPWIMFASQLKNQGTVKDIFKVLKDRSDAGRAVMSIYNSFEFDETRRWPYVDFMTLNLLASASEIYDKLTHEEARAAVAVALRKLEQFKQEDDHDYSWYSCFLIGRVMRNSEYEPLIKFINADNSLEEFLDTQSPMFNDYEAFIKIAYSYIQ